MTTTEAAEVADEEENMEEVIITDKTTKTTKHTILNLHRTGAANNNKMLRIHQ